MPGPKGSKRRDEFIHAAAVEFDEVGYAAASLSRITARLGKTKGATAYYFATKAQLAHAVVETQYSQWEDVAEVVRGGGYQGIDALIVLSFVVAKRFRDDVLVRAALRLLDGGEPAGVELPTPFVAWIAITTRLLTEAESLGEIAAALDLREAAEVLVAVFAGAQRLSKRLSNTEDLEERVRAYWLLFLPGLDIHDGSDRVPRLAAAAVTY